MGLLLILRQWYFKKLLIYLLTNNSSELFSLFIVALIILRSNLQYLHLQAIKSPLPSLHPAGVEVLWEHRSLTFGGQIPFHSLTLLFRIEIVHLRVELFGRVNHMFLFGKT